MARLVTVSLVTGIAHIGRLRFADMAQLAEQLICNQQVFGSSPNIGFDHNIDHNMGGFPSGQRGQTVNLLSTTSMVRIHLHPFTTGSPQSLLCGGKESRRSAMRSEPVRIDKSGVRDDAGV